MIALWATGCGGITTPVDETRAGPEGGVPRHFPAGEAADGAATGGSAGGAGTGEAADGAATGEATAGAATGGAPSEFDACVGALPLCTIAQRDTAQKLQKPCGKMELIPIPLKDGTTYRPVTVDLGPGGVLTDWNQGAGTEFENPANPDELTCDGVIDAFGEPTAFSDDLKNDRGMVPSLYTIFRPACMQNGETYPVITWANGTCIGPHGYAVLLGAVASHGYVVIASNSTWTNTPPTDAVQTRALDYAESINQDPNSPLYGRLDLDHVGAMGHSQGAPATIAAAADRRVDAVILWNGGNSSDKPFLNVSADEDILGLTPALMQSGVDASPQPGAWVYLHQILSTGGGVTGHLVTVMQPNRLWEMAVKWWDWKLKGSDDGKAFFVGDSCGLCNRGAELEYGHNALLQ